MAVAFTGDGGSNQGTVFEAMNLAVVLQLPVIFVFENNGFGEGTGHDYAVGSRDIAGRASGFGMPAVRVDGRDFFAVYAAAGEAVGGPVPAAGLRPWRPWRSDSAATTRAIPCAIERLMSVSALFAMTIR